MYQPAPHRQDDRGAQHALIRANPLGVFIHTGASGLVADHIPFLLDADASEKGVLQCHVARANPLWRAIDGREALVVFADANAYVSPGFYPSKRETGKVVPTWNYAVVHASGTARVMDDRAWLRRQIEALTTTHEAQFPAPWKVSDAPADFIEQMLSAIVGIEILITRIEGKWKLSQNRIEIDRAGVRDSLAAQGGDHATRIAAMVDEARKS